MENTLLTDDVSTDTKKSVHNVHVQSKFMEHHIAGSKTDGGHSLEIIKDRDGNRYLFAIGNNQSFYAFIEDASTHAGWVLVDLMKGITSYEIKAFAAIKDSFGRPTVVLGASFKNDPTKRSVVLSTSDFSADDNPDRWLVHDAYHFTNITHIVAGHDDQDNLNVVVATESLPTQNQGKDFIAQIQLWMVNMETYNKTWGWKALTVPMDIEKVLNLQLGKIDDFLGYGAYIFYQTMGQNNGVFIDIPSCRFHASIVGSDQASSIFAFKNEDETTDLIMAANNLFMLSANHQTGKRSRKNFEENKVIISPDLQTLSGNIKQIAVGKNPDNKQRVWLLDTHSNLYFSDYTDENKWTTLQLFEEGIGHFTVYQDKIQNTSEIFYITNDDELYHKWMDKVTTLWCTQMIEITDLKSVISTHAYGTNVVFTDELGLPVNGQTCEITSSTLTKVTINGEHLFLDHKPTTIQSNALGQISITIRANDSLLAPTLYLTGDFTQQKMVIDPGSDVKNKLVNLANEAKDFQEFKKLVASFTKEVDDNDLKALYQMIKQGGVIEQKIAEKKQGQQKRDVIETTNLYTPDTSGVYYADPVYNATTIADLGLEGHAWGASINKNGQLTYLDTDNSTVQLAIQETSGKRSIDLGGELRKAGHFIGDVIEFLGRKIREAGFFVIHIVREGVEFVVGHHVYFFDTLEHYWKVVTGFVAKFWEAFKEFVAFAFNLENYKNAAATIKHQMNALFDGASDFVKEVTQNVDDKLDALKAKVDHFFGLTSEDLDAGKALKNPKFHGVDVLGTLGYLLSNPATNIIPHLGKVILQEGESLIEHLLQNVMSNKLTADDWEKLGENIKNRFEKDFGNLSNNDFRSMPLNHLINDRGMLMHEIGELMKTVQQTHTISPKAILDLVKKVIGTEVDQLVVAIKILVDELSAYLVGMIEGFKDDLNTPITIPVISAYFGFKLPSLLDIVVYPMAVPVALMLELTVGKDEAEEILKAGAKSAFFSEFDKVLLLAGDAKNKTQQNLSKRSVEANGDTKKEEIKGSLKNYLLVGSIIGDFCLPIRSILEFVVDIAPKEKMRPSSDKLPVVGHLKPSTAIDFLIAMLSLVESACSFPMWEGKFPKVEENMSEKEKDKVKRERITVISELALWSALVIETGAKIGKIGWHKSNVLYKKYHAGNTKRIEKAEKIEKYVSLALTIADIVTNSAQVVLTVWKSVEETRDINKDSVEDKSTERVEIGLSAFVNVEQGVSGIYHGIMEIADYLGISAEKDSLVNIIAASIVLGTNFLTTALEAARISISEKSDIGIKNKIGGGNKM
ncbi:hypothetical protein [Microscilla marina]|uniref:Uncharacterized protein n=1 Tax=Microscilla marina ATCC 23134 TaxID=313606 RepID=A1ZMC0_MICM2|nr:hypothetical protein [Microscilla marina]EAY28300.1 hypothetical protein M23134_03852 [Microscilla marina ATCC 23134]